MSAATERERADLYERAWAHSDNDVDVLDAALTRLPLRALRGLVAHLDDEHGDHDEHPDHTCCADGCGLAVTHQGACREHPGGAVVCGYNEHDDSRDEPWTCGRCATEYDAGENPNDSGPCPEVTDDDVACAPAEPMPEVVRATS